MVELRKTLLLPLDDLRAVTHEFIHPAVSRSGVDRCLRRHGISTLKALMPQEEGAKTPVKTFKAYAPGFVHIDVKYLPQMPDQEQRCYLFAAIDRATRWVYVETLEDKSATAASDFLACLIDKAPFTISVDLSLPFQDSEDDCFTPGFTPLFSPNTAGAKRGFIHFNFAGKRR